MKILVLNGSPKKTSDTMGLTSHFLKGLTDNTSNTAMIINVIEKNIKPCLGCFGCWKMNNEKCIQDDDLNDILEALIESDIIIWSFPLYCYGMPSHLKAVLDRTIPLAKQSMKEIDGRVVHDRLVDMSHKKYIVITGCGFPNWDGNFNPVIDACRNCFGSSLTSICVPETPLINEPDAKPLVDPLLDRFFLAGKEYAKTLSLSKETIKGLENPLIPNEAYIQIVNSR